MNKLKNWQILNHLKKNKKLMAIIANYSKISGLKKCHIINAEFIDFEYKKIVFEKISEYFEEKSKIIENKLKKLKKK